MRKKVVTINGGSGGFIFLSGLKKDVAKKEDEESTEDNDIIYLRAIAASTDSGGSSGELRDEFGTLPQGDIRRHLIALSDAPRFWRELFKYRFENCDSRVNGHSLGNLMMTAAVDIYGRDEKKALDALHELLAVRGRVMPSTWDKAHINALYEDGIIREGEHNIDKYENPNNKRIEKLYSNQRMKANPEALEAIANADAIIIGPGDLYTSIICNLLTDGVAEEIRKNEKALKIYNCNIMTKPSETPNYTVVDHFNDLEKYLGRGVIDIVVYNDKMDLDSHLLQNYAAERKQPVVFREQDFRGRDVTLYSRDLANVKDIVRHNSKKIARLMMDILFP